VAVGQGGQEGTGDTRTMTDMSATRDGRPVLRFVIYPADAVQLQPGSGPRRVAHHPVAKRPSLALSQADAPSTTESRNHTSGT
jgi:hypothetical protein